MTGRNGCHCSWIRTGMAKAFRILHASALCGDREGRTMTVLHCTAPQAFQESPWYASSASAAADQTGQPNYRSELKQIPLVAVLTTSVSDASS